MTAETKHFEEAQANLLAHYGTRASSRFLDLTNPSLRVHVLEAGEGNPVVLLHGGGGMAVQTEPLLGRLAARHQVIAPDRPGCGLTEFFDYRGVDFRRHGSAFVESLLDALDIDKAAVVASSISGLWGLQAGLDHPDRVTCVALVGSPAGLTDDVPLPLRITALPGLGSLLRSTLMRPTRSNVKRQFEEFVSELDAVPPEMIEATLAASQMPGAQDSFGTLIESVISIKGFRKDQVIIDELHGLDLPVLMVWGSEDDVYPPSVGEEAHSSLPNGRLEIVDGAGHFVWMDAPDRTADLIDEFLDQRC